MSDISQASVDYLETTVPRYANREVNWQIRCAFEAGAFWRVRHAPDRNRRIEGVERTLRAHIFPPMDTDGYRELATMLVDDFEVSSDE